MFIVFVVAVFIMLLIGFPIFLALVAPSIWYITQGIGLANIVPLQRFTYGMNNFSLLSVPFFIIAATVMSRGEIGSRLLKFVRIIFGHLNGGLAVTTTVTCMIIGAISGAGSAGIVTIGPLVKKEMLKSKYGESFTCGLITTASSLAMLIPPSIAGIIYAINANVSIAKIFIAGLGPGLIFGLFLMIYSYFYAKITKVELQQRSKISELLHAFKEAGWALGLPFIILGGIYSGIFSPTEAAGVAAVYAILVELFIYKDIKLSEVFDLIVSAGVTMAMVYVILGAGSVLAYSLSLSQIPNTLVNSFSGATYFSIIIFMNICFFIAGMFVDPGSAIIILMPLFLPMAKAMDMDLIHLGAIAIFNLSLGMLTPPFGLNLFVSSSVLNIPISKLIRSCVPFIVIGIFVLMLITFIPQLVMVFPNMLMR